jgi:hypothetical protein
MMSDTGTAGVVFVDENGHGPGVRLRKMKRAENPFGIHTPDAESARRSDAILAGENGRRAAESEKTARLRALREAKEADEREHGPGFRLRKGK